MLNSILQLSDLFQRRVMSMASQSQQVAKSSQEKKGGNFLAKLTKKIKGIRKPSSATKKEATQPSIPLVSSAFSGSSSTESRVIPLRDAQSNLSTSGPVQSTTTFSSSSVSTSENPASEDESSKTRESPLNDSPVKQIQPKPSKPVLSIYNCDIFSSPYEMPIKNKIYQYERENYFSAEKDVYQPNMAFLDLIVELEANQVKAFSNLLKLFCGDEKLKKLASLEPKVVSSVKSIRRYHRTNKERLSMFKEFRSNFRDITEYFKYVFDGRSKEQLMRRYSRVVEFCHSSDKISSRCTTGKLSDIFEYPTYFLALSKKHLKQIVPSRERENDLKVYYSVVEFMKELQAIILYAMFIDWWRCCKNVNDDVNNLAQAKWFFLVPSKITIWSQAR